MWRMMEKKDMINTMTNRRGRSHKKNNSENAKTPRLKLMTFGIEVADALYSNMG